MTFEPAYGRTHAPLDARDLQLLHHTLELAERGRRGARPNPVVGAVVARDGEVLAEGWHARYGDLHAETAALAQLADGRAVGATLYVSLEPCAHHGRQPPCTAAIVEARIARVAIAAPDSNPTTAGAGPRALAAAGVDVAWGPHELAAAATGQNAGFHSVHRRGRPFVTYKWAMTRNLRLATGDARRRWVSGEASRAQVHEMRAGSGAIAVGVDTAIADDPQLTVRGDARDGMERDPLRVVFDRTLRLPLDLALVRSAREVATLAVCAPDADHAREAALRERGVEVWRAPDPSTLLADSMTELARRGVNDVLLESGPRLANAFLQAGLLDALACFTAPFDAPADEPGFVPDDPLVALQATASPVRTGDDELRYVVLQPVEPAPRPAG